MVFPRKEIRTGGLLALHSLFSPLFDLLRCFRPLLDVRGRLLLLRSRLRLIAELDIDGEMIRTEGRQSLKFYQLEMIGMEDMIEGPPEQRILRAKCIIHAAADARIKEPANL